MKDAKLRWHPASGVTALAELARIFVLQQAADAIAARDAFHLVLAGGETPQALYALLREAETDWARWHIWFGDERCLAPDDPARNSRLAATAWLDHVPVPPAQRHAIPGELGAYKGAGAYAAELRGQGLFDLVLLGLGEDGHTASLFPGQYWGIERQSRPVLPVFSAPKPPPERISLSAGRLSRSRSVLFLVQGEAKRDALRRWRAGESLPAGAIQPRDGVDVLVDAALLEG